MVIRRLLVAGAVVLALSSGVLAARSDIAPALAGRLLAKKAVTPRTHTTDFATDQLGCIR